MVLSSLLAPRPRGVQAPGVHLGPACSSLLSAEPPACNSPFIAQ